MASRARVPMRSGAEGAVCVSTNAGAGHNGDSLAFLTWSSGARSVRPHSSTRWCLRRGAAGRPRRPHGLCPRAELQSNGPEIQSNRPALRKVSPSSAPKDDNGVGALPGQSIGGFAVLGPPGSGKSQLCRELAKRFKFVHVNIDDLFSAYARYETDIGERLRAHADQLQELPDDVAVAVVLDRLKQHDCHERGFVIDGMPMNLAQEAALKKEGLTFLRVFMLHAPRQILERRLHYRRIDPETNDVYNTAFWPPASREVADRLVELPEDVNADVVEQLSKYGQDVSTLWETIGPHSVAINANRSPHEIFHEVALMVEASGRKNADGGADTLTPTRPEHIHTQQGPKENGSSTKTPITLIRCDGYMCERESVQDSDIKFRGAATEQVMLVWNQFPRTVLLLVKRDPSLIPYTLQAARHLIEDRGMTVVVEPSIQNEALANGVFLESFTQSDSLNKEIDLVVCLGGDGLILHAVTLFKTAVPPLVSFNFGSLGFLTPFDFNNFTDEINYVLEGSCLMSLRMRLHCKIVRGSESKLPAREFSVLNEVVIDRGSSPYLSNLDCFCDDKFITTVQADGIIMSTPTGSTAYSMSAGGSMVHPSVPAILFTPICPHSLSFRPIIFPDAAMLRVDVNINSRSHAWASFDGKYRQLLRRGDGLVVQMGLYPVPTINKTDHTGDWFSSLDRAFNFNIRPSQKPLDSKSTGKLPS